MNTAEPLVPELLTPRFEMLAQLGAGGMGVVYEVHDLETDATLAAKTLTAMSAEQAYWLKAEFRRLADVSHRNLVQLGELFYDGSTCFFTMERVHGIDLQRYVRSQITDPADDEPTDRTITMLMEDGSVGATAPANDVRSVRTASPQLDEKRVRACFAQLAEALRTLHGFGIVHRDLKPSNILVEPSGRVVVLDFGIASTLARAEQKAEHQKADNDNTVRVFHGTPSFMAPEQVRGQAPEPAADWYAFGVLLFYALTGSLPFSGGAASQLRAKQALDAPAPSELVRDVPADLDALCVQLLSRSPAQRPRGAQVSSVLTGALKRAPTSSYRVNRGVFVGRGAELARLHRALDRVTRGEVVALAVEGDPGLGKTELVREFLSEVHTAGRPLLVLGGRCYEQEFVAFKGLDGAIDTLSHQLKAMDQAQLARILPSRFHLVAALFPVLYRVPAIAANMPPSELNESKPEQRSEAVAQLSMLLRALARDVCLVIFIDDLQWAGDDSLAVLRGLCEGPERTPLLLLATRRSSAEAGTPRASGGSVYPAPATRALNMEVMALSPLSTDEATALTTQIFTSGDGSRIDAAHAELVLREAGGHPLFLRELARALERGDVLPRQLRLEHVLLARISALEPERRRLLEAVAVAGVPLPEQVFAQVCGIDRALSARIVRTLRGEQLIRTGSTEQHRVTLEPYHDRVREAVVDAIALGSYKLTLAPDIATIHFALAKQLVRARDEDGLTVASTMLAQQFSLGAGILAREGTEKEIRAAIDAYLEAARQARLGAAYPGAMRHIEAARAAASLLSGDAARVSGRVVEQRALELSTLADDHVDARASFQRALALSRGDSELADVYRGKIQAHLAKSQHAEALATAREGLRKLDYVLPSRGSLVQTLKDAARLELLLRGRTPETILTMPLSTDERMRAQSSILIVMTPAAYFTDTLLMSSISTRVARLTLEHGLCESSPSSFNSYAVALAGKFHQYRRAQKLCKLANKLNERIQNPALECKLVVLHNLFVAPYAEPVDDIVPRFRRAQELGLMRGDLIFRTYAGIGPPVFSLIAGTPLGRVLTECETSVRIAEQTGYPDMVALSRWRKRAASCLHGSNPELLRLDGSSGSEATLVHQTEAPEYEGAHFTYGLMRAVLGCHAGDYAYALRGGSVADRSRVSQAFMPTLVDLDAYRALAAARVSETAGLIERTKLLAIAASCVRRLARVAHESSRNFEAYHLLARGASLAAAGSQGRARRDLQEAAERAHNHDQHNVAALAHEQLAEWEARHGTRGGRRVALRQARAAYEQWEAWACVRRIDWALAEMSTAGFSV